jgi:exosortase
MSLAGTTTVAPDGPALATRTALLVAYSLVVGFAGGTVLSAVIDLSLRDSSYSHIVVVPFISLALLYRGRASIFSNVEFGWRGGMALIGAAFVVYAIASRFQLLPNPQDALTQQMAVLVVLWMAGFVLVYGPHAFRAGIFPLLLLAFMIPIPSAVLAATTHVLTAGTAAVLGGLYTVTGTDYHRDGSVFVLSKVTIRIADECSGIRSTIALVLVGLVIGHARLANVRSRVLLLAAVFPLSLLKNAIRIATLTLLAVHVDSGFLTGRLHQQGGIIFFLFAVALIELVLVALRRSEQPGAAGHVARAVAKHA